MKRLTCLLFAVALFCYSAFSVSAVSKKHTIGDVTFSVSSDFTVHTEKDLLSSSNVEGLLFAAIAKDSNDQIRHQIQGRCSETEFSRQLGTFIGLDSETLAPVGQALFPDGYEVAEINSITFLKHTLTDSEGSTSIYITVNDSKLYTFTYFGSDATKMGEFMTSVKLPINSKRATINVYVIVLISIFIVADVILIAFIVISFVKDHRQRKMEANENVVSQYIKIKRRKF